MLVPLDDLVVFPNMSATLTIDVGDEERVLLVPRADDRFASVGTVAEVIDHVRLPGGARAVELMGLHRGIAGAARTGLRGELRVEVEEREDDVPVDGRTRELEREYRAVVEEILELRGDDGRVAQFVRSITEPGTLADTSGYSPDISYEQKVELLETLDVTERLELALRLELDRLERMGEGSGETSVIRTYLDWIVSVPWSQRSDERLDPVHAREVLDADHAGLEDVKERITEYIAVKKLRTERGIAEDRRSS